MMQHTRSLKKGIYLVINPADDRFELMAKLTKLVDTELAAVQIWDNFTTATDPISFINEVVSICHKKAIPVLLNNHWELVKETNADGVHFDLPPHNISNIRQELPAQTIYGITCGNDLSLVSWANENGMSYISFCSVFPSSTSNSCELVRYETIQQANLITHLPIFLAGGITPDKIQLLNDVPFTGVAVISGILRAVDPVSATWEYIHELNELNKKNP